MSYLQLRGKVWYYTISIDGDKQEIKGLCDKRETERLAAAAEELEARRRASLLDPHAERFANAELRPLVEHLDDYRRHLDAKGDSPKYVDLVVGRTRTLIDLIGADRLSDLTPSAVQNALGTLRKEKALATVNHYRATIRGFST